MNLFEAQQRARSTSRWLVAGFALSVIGVVVVLYLLAAIWLTWSTQAGPAALWNPQLATIIMPTTASLIVGGSLFKLARLSAGGEVVARGLGGRRIDDTPTDDPAEQRLLHVVEEMSIASNTPMPQVWVMDAEDGINAFAAGTEPANAAIGVTAGALHALDRAELQGVVAHEFSHIANGDMRLNMRLLGWVFGLVLVATLGRWVLRSLRHTRSSSNSKKGKGLPVALIIGLALWLTGSVGVLFARLLQAAVSRQREFLADAAAVQFTRHPEGLAGALRKIGADPHHGRVAHVRAAEARHLFFAGSEWINFGFATHPPLAARIRAIEALGFATPSPPAADPHATA